MRRVRSGRSARSAANAASTVEGISLTAPNAAAPGACATRPSSSSASGFPAARSSTDSRTNAFRAKPARRSSEPAARLPRGSSASRGCDSNPSGALPRAATTSETGSAARRLATNASTERELGSTQCTSSRPPGPTGRRPAVEPLHQVQPQPQASGGCSWSSRDTSGPATGPRCRPPRATRAGRPGRRTGASRSVARPVMDKTMSPSAAAARLAVARTARLALAGNADDDRGPPALPQQRPEPGAGLSRPTSPSSSPAHSPTPGPATPDGRRALRGNWSSQSRAGRPRSSDRCAATAGSLV